MFAASSPLLAEDASGSEYSSEPHLEGVERSEATQLILDLQDAQTKLRSGEKIFFSLLSGAPASYDAANLGARDAFISLDWGRALNVRKMDPGNPHWTGYHLELLPDGYGELVWDVRVWRNASGNFARIELFNRPPSPF